MEIDMNNLSWANVFNTSHKRYGFITYAQEAAKAAGYEYFCWNDLVIKAQDGTYTGYKFDPKNDNFIQDVTGKKTTITNLIDMSGTIRCRFDDGAGNVHATLDYAISTCIQNGMKIENAQEVLEWLHKSVDFRGYNAR